MAKLGNILFSRTLNQYLECKNLSDKKGLAITEKVRPLVKGNLDKVLETINQVNEPHKEALKELCRETVEGATLFGRLQSPEVTPADIIDILEPQKHLFKPEDIINNALKLEPADAILLLKLVEGSEQPIDLSKLSLQTDRVDSPEFKTNLLRYLSSVAQPQVALILIRFMSDSNNVVVLEALQALERLSVSFDAALLLPCVESMTGVQQELALKIIDKQADASLIPHLSPYLNGKSADINDFFAKIIARETDKPNFIKLLTLLNIGDEWTQQQAMASLQKFSTQNLSDIARELTEHQKPFIRNAAQQLVINLLDEGDIGKIGEFAMSDNWQARERAVQALGKSSNRASIPILKKVVEQWPDTAILVLRALKQLGFGKGLEIAFDCLKSREANIQRAALETIEALTSEKHASNIRDVILWHVPGLTHELKGFARQLIDKITGDYGLPILVMDDDSDDSGGFARIPESDGADRGPKKSVLDKLRPGSIWMDRYHIKKEIGRGAMGRVMLVRDEMVEESLILKFMLPELTIDKRSTERFKREVKYARKVGHRNVIRVHDLLLKDDICAISMEYFKSRGLEVILDERGSFEALDGLKVLYQVASGMADAHDQAVIHRDLKPSNILINEAGHVKVVDFGIASANTSADSTLTQTGSIIGSPAYLAPERANGGEADARSDIYSLGIVAYYLFSGKLPYSGKPMETLAQHRKGKAPPLDQVNQSIPAEVARLVGEMMAVNPDKRPESMTAVSDQIKGMLDSK